MVKTLIKSFSLSLISTTPLFAPFSDILDAATNNHSAMLPTELKREIAQQMLRNALVTLPDTQKVNLPFQSCNAPLAWSQDGSTIAAVTPTTRYKDAISLFKFGKKIKKQQAEYPTYSRVIDSLALSKDGSDILVNTANSSYGINTLTTSPDEQIYLSEQSSESPRLLFAPRHDGSPHLIIRLERSVLKIFDAHTHTLKRAFPLVDTPSSFMPYIISHRPETEEIAIASFIKTDVYDLEQGFIKTILPEAHQALNQSIAFDPKGTHIALASRFNLTIHKVDDAYAEDSAATLCLDLPHSVIYETSQLNWSPQGTDLALLSRKINSDYLRKHKLAIYHVDHIEKELSRETLLGDCNGFAWHPEGYYFATPHGISVWKPQQALYNYFFNSPNTHITLEQMLFTLVLLACKRPNEPLSISHLIKKNEGLFTESECEQTYKKFPERIQNLLHHIFDLRHA